MDWEKYEECLQTLKDMHSRGALEEKVRGKYDDLIDKNPNLRVIAELLKQLNDELKEDNDKAEEKANG